MKACPSSAIGAATHDHDLGANEMRLNRAGLELVEISVLALQRAFFQSFAIPESQSWMHGADTASERFGAKDGMSIWRAVLTQVQQMRHARQSCFSFSNPQCAVCCQMLTADERQLAFTLKAIRQGQLDWARTHAMILCEGGEVAPFIQATQDLARLLVMPDRAYAVH